MEAEANTKQPPDALVAAFQALMDEGDKQKEKESPTHKPKQKKRRVKKEIDWEDISLLSPLRDPDSGAIVPTPAQERAVGNMVFWLRSQPCVKCRQSQGKEAEEGAGAKEEQKTEEREEQTEKGGETEDKDDKKDKKNKKSKKKGRKPRKAA